MPETQTWTRTIAAGRGLFEIPWRELWRYRDLIRLLSRRDLAAQFKQTVLGPLWIVIQPLMTTLAFSFLFGRMLGVGTGHVPHFLFYMGGMVPWLFFADCVLKNSGTFVRNQAMFSKVYFPRLAVPLAQVCTSLVTFCVQFSVFLLGVGFYMWKMKYASDPAHPIHVAPNWRMVLLPLILVQIAMLGLGAGMIVSSLSTRYRDFQLIVAPAVQLWMYASSIVYPLERVAPEWRGYFALNPMIPIIETFRLAFTGAGLTSAADFALSFATCAVVFLIGVLMFNHTEQRVVDTV